MPWYREPTNGKKQKRGGLLPLQIITFLRFCNANAMQGLDLRMRVSRSICEVQD